MIRRNMKNLKVDFNYWLSMTRYGNFFLASIEMAILLLALLAIPGFLAGLVVVVIIDLIKGLFILPIITIAFLLFSIVKFFHWKLTFNNIYEEDNADLEY